MLPGPAGERWTPASGLSDSVGGQTSTGPPDKARSGALGKQATSVGTSGKGDEGLISEMVGEHSGNVAEGEELAS
eukprot:4578722-Alexandrium_andersonii.AAC.1